jgi:hypothetical protein
MNATATAIIVKFSGRNPKMITVAACHHADTPHNSGKTRPTGQPRLNGKH